MHHKSISSATTNVHHFLGNTNIKDAKNIATFIFGNQNAKNSNGSFPFELVDIFGSEYPTYVEITYQDGKTEEMPCYDSDIIKHHSNNKNKASIIANIKKLDKIGCEINYKEIGLLGVSTINGEYYNLKTNKIILEKDSIVFQRLEDGIICKIEYIYSDICTEHLKRILLSMD
jgi:hypothetical protein